MGNIYASESLWQARLDPRRVACRLTAIERARLARAIGTVMRKAIGWGDAIFEKYAELAVYGRAGQPCRRCGTPIRRIVQQQRSTFFCWQCQR